MKSHGNTTFFLEFKFLSKFGFFFLKIEVRPVSHAALIHRRGLHQKGLVHFLAECCLDKLAMRTDYYAGIPARFICQR